MDRSLRAERERPPLASLGLGLLAFALTAGAYGAIQATRNREVLVGLFGAGATALLALSFAGVAATAWALVREWRRSRSESAARLAERAVLGLLVFLAWVVVYHVALQPYERFTVEATLPVAAGLWALLVDSDARGRWRLPKLAAKLVLSASLLLVLTEVALRLLSLASPAPLLTTTLHGPSVQLAAGRFRPGEVRWGFACNPDGFFDEPFLPRSERERPMVALVGDSFVAGIVPHPFHFATAAERLLGGVDLYAFGVPGVGPPVYRHLVQEEVLPLAPDAVVVCLFAGNDLTDLNTFSGTDLALRQVFDAQQNYLRTVFDRAWQLLRSGQGLRLRDRADFHSPVLTGAAEIERWFPWVVDHHAERPTMPRDVYVDLATRRAAVACLPHEERFEALARELTVLRELSAPVPIAVVLFPAEFQVEEELWAEVRTRLEEDGAPSVERDLLQTEVAELCGALELPLLDLLPSLRDAEVLPDGSRHVYHLYDSHLNVRGNHLVAKALARFLLEIR